MSWQAATRSVFLFTVALQLGSAQLVGTAADRAIQRQFISEAWQHGESLSESDWHESFESARFILIEMYNAPPDSLLPLTPVEIRVLRRQLADVLGLDARSIDSQMNSTGEIEKQWDGAATWRPYC